MGLPGFLANLFGGNVVEGIANVVDRFVQTPDEKRAFEEVKSRMRMDEAKLAADIEAQRLTYEAKIVEAASANIRAEAASGDKFTSRARPTFLYVGNFIILWNYVISPLFGKVPLNFPEPLFWLFGSVMLGYVGARSWEKLAGAKNGNGK